MLGVHRELLSFIFPWRQSSIKVVYIAFPVASSPSPKLPLRSLLIVPGPILSLSLTFNADINRARGADFQATSRREFD